MRLGQGAVSQVPGFLENSCLKQEEGEKEEEEKMELLSLPAGAGDQVWRSRPAWTGARAHQLGIALVYWCEGTQPGWQILSPKRRPEMSGPGLVWPLHKVIRDPASFSLLRHTASIFKVTRWSQMRRGGMKTNLLSFKEPAQRPHPTRLLSFQWPQSSRLAKQIAARGAGKYSLHSRLQCAWDSAGAL